MKILVDADGCPVKSIIVKIAKKYKISVTMFVNTSHLIDDKYSKVVIVGKGADSVDFALISNTDKGDIIVTQDYGVAAMALSKKAHAVNQNGLIYTNENIDSLLLKRHVSQKIRRSGGRTNGPKKRKKEDNERFERIFEDLIKDIVN